MTTTLGPDGEAISLKAWRSTMDARTRKKLVRQWKRFASTLEEAWEQADDTRSGQSTGELISEADLEIRVIRTRATYLKGLVEAGILNPYQGPPDDDRLWEIHPINTEPDGGDLFA